MPEPTETPKLDIEPRGRTTLPLMVGSAALAVLGSWMLFSTTSDPAPAPAGTPTIAPPASPVSRTATPLETTPAPASTLAPAPEDLLQSSTTQDQEQAQKVAAVFISAWRERSWQSTADQWREELSQSATDELVRELDTQTGWDSVAWDRYQQGRSITTVQISSSTATQATAEGIDVIVEFDVATTSEDPLERANPRLYRMMLHTIKTPQGWRVHQVSDLAGAGGL